MEKLNQRLASEARNYGAAATFGAVVGAAVAAGIACGIVAWWAATGKKLQTSGSPLLPPKSDVTVGGMTQRHVCMIRALRTLPPPAVQQRGAGRVTTRVEALWVRRGAVVAVLGWHGPV